MSNSQTIARNTMYLYFRMFLIMAVSLYTSRVVLQQLGVSDYGIYSLVGGIVAMLGFFNAAMSSATQRYLSFDIGKGDEQKLQKTFSATLTIHVLIAILAFVLAETIGLWYVNYKMVFPENRLYAVNMVYQFSVLTFLLNIIQVPYNALIIAREKMNIYAYVSILEVFLKLAVVFLIILAKDKLVMYSVLTFFIALLIRVIYQIYCRKQFKESKYKYEYDKLYFNELLTYSGWNLFGNFAAVCRGQGVNVVLNLFFGTIINAAYGITMQVQMAVQMFVSNFQMAVNPQIIQTYAKGEILQSIMYTLKGIKASFFLLIVIIIPLMLKIDFVLSIWLGDNVPFQTNLFIQLMLISILLDALSGPLMTLITATGNIKIYHLCIGGFNLLVLVVSYLLFLFGYYSYTVFYVLVLFSLLSFIFRFMFVKKYINISWKLFYDSTLKPCLKVLVFVSLIIFTLTYLLEYLGWIINSYVLVGFYIVLICFFILLLGLDSTEKRFIVKLIKNKIQ